MLTRYLKNHELKELLQLILVLISGLAILFYEYSNRWIFLGKTEVDFGDLGYVINCGQAISPEIGFFSDNGCDTYMYGSINLRIIELLNLNDFSIIVGGSIFFFFITLLFAKLVLVLSRREITLGIFCSAIFFSPPIELILQRANLDALIFILVISSAITFSKGKKFFAMAILAICSLMKFYTLPLLIFVSLFTAVKLRSYRFSQIYLIAVIVIAAIDISRVPFFPWDARNMFGIPIYAEYLSFVLEGENSHSNRILASASGLIIFGSILFLIHYLSKRFAIYPDKSAFSRYKQRLSIFFFSFIVFLSCFIAGLNIDYRLIFLAIPVLVFLSFDIKGFLSFSISTLLLIVMFTSYNTYLLQPVGDLVIMALTSYFTIFLWKEREVFLDLFNPKLKPH